MRLTELRRSEKEKASLPIKAEEYGHDAAVAFLEDKDLTMYGVTMTNLPKVGVNPRSTYNTPLGIYFYPADYYYDTITKNKRLPFMHDALYIQIFKITTNKILFLDDYTHGEFNRDINTLMKLIPKTTQPAYNNREEIARYVENSAIGSKVPHLWGGKFWYVLWKTSELFANQTQRNSNKLSKDYQPPPRPSVVWNWLLRQLDYKVVIDLDNGIIHENELTQGVIIDTKGTFRVVKRVNNKTTDKVAVKLYGSKLNDPSVSDSEKVNIIKINPSLFKIVQDPSEDLKYAAVSQLGRLIRYIKNPSVELQKKAVTSDSEAIEFIENPDVEAQMIAVELDPYNIRYIKHPHPKVQLYLAKTRPYWFGRIENPSRSIVKYMVFKNPKYIEYVNNPDLEIQLLAVSKLPRAIGYIRKQEPAAQLKAVQLAKSNDLLALKHDLHEPTQEVIDLLKERIAKMEKDYFSQN